MMRDRKDRDVVLESNEHDVIGEVVNREAPYVRIRDTTNDCARIGKPLEVLKRLSDFRGEALGYLGVSFAVPVGRLAQLTPCALA